MMPIRLLSLVVTLGVMLFGAGCTGDGSRTSAATATDTATQSAYVGNIASGREAFTINCATCHGATGREGGVGPALTDEKARKNYDETIAWIENPLPPMPKLYPSPISRETVEDIAAYVQSI
jgi:mono/diheme cytochrome c family protein